MANKPEKPGFVEWVLIIALMTLVVFAAFKSTTAGACTREFQDDLDQALWRSASKLVQFDADPASAPQDRLIMLSAFRTQYQQLLDFKASCSDDNIIITRPAKPIIVPRQGTMEFTPN